MRSLPRGLCRIRLHALLLTFWLTPPSFTPEGQDTAKLICSKVQRSSSAILSRRARQRRAHHLLSFDGRTASIANVARCSEQDGREGSDKSGEKLFCGGAFEVVGSSVLAALGPPSRLAAWPRSAWHA